MTGVLQSLVFFFFLDQVYSYRKCHIYHPDQDRLLVIRCSDSQYCCDKGCCRKVYTIWYFWTLLLFGLFIGIIFCWWYKAHERRGQVRVEQRSVIPMQVVQPYPPHVLNGTNRHDVPKYPAYPYAYAPPPYSLAASQPPPNQLPPPSYILPNQQPSPSYIPPNQQPPPSYIPPSQQPPPNYVAPNQQPSPSEAEIKPQH